MLNNIIHFLRYGTHSEKDFFLGDFENYSDGVIVNGNMVAYTPKAMSAFVLTLKKPFFIDPQTHIFQHNSDYLTNKNGSVKQSIKNLAKQYGEITESSIENKTPLSVEEFNNETKRKEFVKNVIDFQSSTLKNIISSGSESDYVNFALEDPQNGLSLDNITPKGIIAPYFYLNSTDEKYLDLNKQFVVDALEIYKGKESLVITEIVITKNLLMDSIFKEKLVEVYGGLSNKTIFLWIDDFDETDVSKELLDNFKDFIVKLTSKDKSVVNLYGGYFSVLLTKIEGGLKSVCHGMEYGESRKVVPVGGGLPKAKYYFYPLHKRLAAEDFGRILSTNSNWLKGSKDPEFKREICSCIKCENLDQFTETQTYVVKSKNGTRKGETSTSAAKQHSLEHYLNNKKREFEFVKNNTIVFLIEDLKNSNTKYSTSMANDSKHLSKWIDCLENK